MIGSSRRKEALTSLRIHRRRMSLLTSAATGYFPNVLQRMIVEDVRVNALNFVRVEIIDADVKIKRDDGQFIAHENGFGLLEKFSARLEVRLVICLADHLIVTDRKSTRLNSSHA